MCGEIATRRKTQDSLGKLNDDMRNYALRDFLTGGTDSRYKVGEFLKKMRVLENYSQYTCLVLAAENSRGEYTACRRLDSTGGTVPLQHPHRECTNSGNHRSKQFYDGR